MPNACNYYCTTLPDHEQISCGAFRKGGINAYAIVDCNHTITDWTDETQWTTNINAGKIKIVGPVVAEVPEPSPVEGTNPNGCGAANILDTFDRTVNIEDYNVNASNLDFYNALNDRKALLVLFHGCETEEITVVETPVTFTAMRSVPKNNREKQMFKVTAKWTQRDEPMLYDAPTGTFDF